MTSEAPPAPEEPQSAGPARRFYLWAALGLVVLSVAAIWIAAQADPSETIPAVDVSKLPVGAPAPELHATGWLNSPPLSGQDLAGTVVVYDFWTYSCVNCVRTLPYLRAWHERYRQDGLVVVGVHSPEFDFEKDHGNVESAVARLKVTWPVALDDEMAIWRDFNNRYWPAKWITDRQGRVRYFHPGEGNYAETENVIRSLLGLAAGAARADDPKAERTAPVEVVSNITQETYLGTERGGVAEDGQHAYTAGRAQLHVPALAGTWQAEPQRIRSVSPEASLSLEYLAREVNLVMATGVPGGGAIDVTVELDGKPLPEGYRTADTRVDADGRTYVQVKASDLYRLVLGPRVEQHTVRLTPRTPGLEAFAYTFGAVVLTDAVALFGAGVASFLAPCLVPLLPAYLGIIAGEAADARNPARAVPATLLFVLGFALVFAGLGATAGLLGSALTDVQNGVQRVGGVVVAIMGLALLGVIRGPLAREKRLITHLPRVTGPIRPVVVGVAFGAAWSPCVGPLLGAALAVAARSGEAGRGAMLLFAYALGIGVPFVLASLGLASSPRLAAWLGRIGPRIERLAGGLLVVLGVLLATGTYRHLTSYLARFTPGIAGL